MKETLIIVAVAVCGACAVICARAVHRVRQAIHRAPETARRQAAREAEDEAAALIEQSERPGGGWQEGWRW